MGRDSIIFYHFECVAQEIIGDGDGEQARYQKYIVCMHVHTQKQMYIHTQTHRNRSIINVLS